MRFDYDKNNFLLDFENWCLETHWDSRVHPHPKGPDRFKHPQWAEMIKRECKDSGTTFEEYSAWCEAGGGDDWFQEEDEEMPTPQQTFWEHRSTRYEIERIQETLRGIAFDLGTIDLATAPHRLECLTNFITETSGRVYRLKLELANPPEEGALAQRPG